MPELPEAESIARTLRDKLRGRRFTRTIVHRRDVIHGDATRLGSSLLNRRIKDVYREGKRVVILLDDCARIVIALGMTGRLTVERVRERVLPHTHLRVSLGRTGLELRFCDPRRFGGVWYLNGGDAHNGRRLSPLGVDALKVRADQFRALLKRNRRIKALLMDQRIIAGLGNIYCDESLHRARIHPLTCASSLTPGQTALLLHQIRVVLRAAIRLGGSTIMDYRNADGRPGGFQHKHRVYNRESLPCRTCKTPIIRIQAAGRSSHLCPRCQPMPAKP
ncbi:MAG: bifunctional DNA-formamidopyrimidine glycosylase/DNA-(apurinic or apyrimidinic site) lyase [Phycisphaerae bacterium]